MPPAPEPSNPSGPSDPAEPPFYARPLAELLAALRTRPEGLSSTEAASRLSRFGRNDVDSPQRVPLVLALLARFRSPLILILLAASALSAATGDLTGFFIITAIVLLGVVLDFVQEVRAERAVEVLRGSVALRSRVRRDGKEVTVPAAELVPGDVVRLTAGDLVPADGRVLVARDLFVNQAQLTGEPYPVEKQPDEAGASIAAPAARGEDSFGSGGQDAARCAVFAGSSVMSGSAVVLVAHTGHRSTLGRLAASLACSPPPTDFELGTRRFGLLILRLTVLVVLSVLIVNLVLHRPWLQSMLFALALAVALTPELLPMITTVTLSRGAIRLARRRVIVKRLAAMHNLGAMDLLCTDKTGTLTEGKIRLVRHLDAAGQESEQVFELAYLNSYFETGIKSALDEAILSHGALDVAAWRKLDEVPFDFERRRVSVLVQKGADTRLVVKGAPEEVLRLCDRYARGSELAPLDSELRQALLKRLDDLGDQGMRALGIGWRAVPADHTSAVVSDEEGLVFAGFATFLDPPKASAAAALRSLIAQGVAIKILTGDSERVACHAARELGLPVKGVLTGAELDRLSDEALHGRLEGVGLFCRISPRQKQRLILALKQRRHVVGFLGDGINDAPALHSADVGISVDSAADVAREAADLILLDQDLSVVHEGVLEGRRTFVNVQKYVLMATSSNFGNMFSMAGASLFLPFLPMLPMQVLLNNLLYDLSEIAIPLDRVDDEAVQRPRRWDAQLVRRFMLLVGPISSVFDLLTFLLLLKVFHVGEALFRTGWFVESLASQALVIFVIRTRRNPLRCRPHPALVALTCAVVALAVALPYTPLAGWLGFVPLPLPLLLALGVAVALYLVCAEGGKRLAFRLLGPGARG
ncbi:MAG: magnesium-translocating P-type ATPase [Polyangia bacterium]